MNKAELVAAMAEKAELSKKDAEAALKAFTDVVAEELKKGEKIQLVGFGTFEVSERAERTGRNPQSGKEMVIPASKACSRNLSRMERCSDGIKQYFWNYCRLYASFTYSFFQS